METTIEAPVAASADPARPTRPALQEALAKHRLPSRRKAILQLVETLAPLGALWLVMIATVRLGFSPWLTAALSVLSAPLLVRVFIIFHDCCHGSFFASRRANQILGYITGALTFTPYEQWRRAHAIHHATAGDLDRRGDGDIWTLTVEEYLAAPRARRFAYRIVRNPLVMLGLGPAIVFTVVQRIFRRGDGPRERRSVIVTDVAIVAVGALACLTIGPWTYFLIQVPMALVAGAIGVWLFYVQHQYEGVYWARHEVWDPMAAALDGSSYYKLPRMLQWFTASIGLHHIHHLQPRIPNYRLQECSEAVTVLPQARPLTFRSSLHSLWLNLWDERRQKLVGFRDLKTLRRQKA